MATGTGVSDGLELNTERRLKVGGALRRDLVSHKLMGRYFIRYMFVGTLTRNREQPLESEWNSVGPLRLVVEQTTKDSRG